MDHKSLLSVLLLVAGQLLASAQSSGGDSSAALGTLPNCALNCIITTATHSPCGLTNQTCLCTNEAVQEEITLCVTANCTVKQALSTKNITSTACGAPIRNRQALFTTTSTTLAVITAVVVSLRIGYKLFDKIRFGLDDWLIIATFFVGLPNSIINVEGSTAHGLGRDIWTVSFDDITAFALFTYIQVPIYFAVLTFLKLSLLAFFLRIFPLQPVVSVLWATFIFTCVYGIVFVLLALFQCRPIDFTWIKWTGEDPDGGQCMNINIIAWANAGISIALDIWMLAIPLYEIRGLQMHWKKKVGVILMFCVGTFVTVVSILRLQALLTYANSMNPTWDNWDTSNWSTIEINVGIMCACMPALRLLLVRLMPRLRGSSAHNSSSKRSGNRGQRRFGTGRSAGDCSTTDSRSGAEILYTNSYSVEHGAAGDHDEASLVHMQDFTWKSSNKWSVGRSTSPA